MLKLETSGAAFQMSRVRLFTFQHMSFIFAKITPNHAVILASTKPHTSVKQYSKKILCIKKPSISCQMKVTVQVHKNCQQTTQNQRPLGTGIIKFHISIYRKLHPISTKN